MNVDRGGTLYRFRGLAEDPAFGSHDAILMPFDTYYPWMAGARRPRRLTDLHLRARMEVHRAAASGATVGFLFEDCFAHFNGLRAMRERSLGGMIMGELGFVPAPLAGPEDHMEVLAAPFHTYLDRFGIAESYLEARRPSAEMRALCRTSSRQITGVAVREGKGTILFLPGDPRNRFLDFFSTLGEAVARFRGRAGRHEHVFTLETPLIQRHQETRRRLKGIDQRLEIFRRRRELLAIADTDADRVLPEWFASFLGVELVDGGEPGMFLIPSRENEARPAAGVGAATAGATAALLVAATGDAGDGLMALTSSLEERRDAGDLLPQATAFLLVLNGSAPTRTGAPSMDVEAEAAAEGVVLLTMASLFALLDHIDSGAPVPADPVELLRSAAAPHLESRLL